MNNSKTPDLNSAYALQTPEDSMRLYADWAETYDQSFASETDYRLPQIVASAFAKAGGTGPVLDIGAGTGLCAQALADLAIGPIDATDISQDMLDVAATKGVYRDVVQGDILAQLPMAADSYAGIVSSGTFTNGHVGPEAFDELLRLAAPGALLCLSINDHHFTAMGFAAKFKALAGQIDDLTLTSVPIFGDDGADAHKDDTGTIALFRKT